MHWREVVRSLTLLSTTTDLRVPACCVTMEVLREYVQRCGSDVNRKIKEGKEPSEDQLCTFVSGIVSELKKLTDNAPDDVKLQIAMPWNPIWKFEENRLGNEAAGLLDLPKLLQILASIRDSLPRNMVSGIGKGHSKGAAQVRGPQAYRGPPLVKVEKVKPIRRKPKYEGRVKTSFDPEWIVQAALARGEHGLAEALQRCTSGWRESKAYIHFVDPGTEAWRFAGNVVLDGGEMIVLDVLQTAGGERIIGGIEFVDRIEIEY